MENRAISENFHNLYPRVQCILSNVEPGALKRLSINVYDTELGELPGTSI